FRLTVSDSELASSADTSVVVEPVGTLHPPHIVSSPVTSLTVDPSSGTPIPPNFNLWTPVNYEFFSQPDGVWVFDHANNRATQTVNSDATILFSDYEFKNDRVEGTLRVNTLFDDDLIGFVFGNQDPQHYYVFDWKKADENDLAGFAERGMSVKVVNASTPLIARDLWNTNGNPGRVRTLFHNTIAWESFVDYKITIEFRQASFTITVLKGATVLESVTLEDSTYTSGRFGFYNYSQSDVVYTGFRRLSVGNYLYDVDAIDSDGDSLT